MVLLKGFAAGSKKFFCISLCWEIPRDYDQVWVLRTSFYVHGMIVSAVTYEDQLKVFVA